jgi:transcriptional regulator with XRE-family HTH domain
MTSETIGDRLKIIRKFLNLNQEAVSRKMQITNQTLSRYEKGTRFPDSQFLQRFGKLYNVNANWMLYGIGDLFLKDSNQNSELEHDKVKELRYYLDKIEQLFFEQQNES